MSITSREKERGEKPTILLPTKEKKKEKKKHIYDNLDEFCDKV